MTMRAPRLPKMPALPTARLPSLPPLPGAKKPERAIGEDATTVHDELQQYTDEARQKFRDDNAKMRADERRFRNVTDSEFWVAICFETRQQKEEFLRSFDLTDLGDKYVDGLAAAKRMGKPIKSPRPEWRAGRENARWRAFVR